MIDQYLDVGVGRLRLHDHVEERVGDDQQQQLVNTQQHHVDLQPDNLNRIIIMKG